MLTRVQCAQHTRPHTSNAFNARERVHDVCVCVLCAWLCVEPLTRSLRGSVSGLSVAATSIVRVFGDLFSFGLFVIKIWSTWTNFFLLVVPADFYGLFKFPILSLYEIWEVSLLEGSTKIDAGGLSRWHMRVAER